MESMDQTVYVHPLYKLRSLQVARAIQYVLPHVNGRIAMEMEMDECQNAIARDKEKS